MIKMGFHVDRVIYVNGLQVQNTNQFVELGNILEIPQ